MYGPFSYVKAGVYGPFCYLKIPQPQVRFNIEASKPNRMMMNTLIKKVKADERTRAIIRNGLEIGQRSIFVISGDKPHDQIAKLYFIIREEEGNRDLVSKEVVWCYEDKLELRSRKKMAKQVECLRRHGILDLEKCPPFSFFLEFAPITPCWYEDSERILGNNTFGMCVFQDFEVLTPNLLATTIQTVDVGGLVILLIPSWERFITESHSWAVDEHVLLSLASCRLYKVIDDKLNVLPISSQPQPPHIEEDFTRQMSRLMIHQGEPYINPLDPTQHQLLVNMGPLHPSMRMTTSPYHHHHHHDIVKCLLLK
ncbi:unnamed protein product [Lactuca virosa]|uniref:TmcA/NAT10 N-terminal domain-containing protein n=1 Tax=Lactuca virosa TaxID=75947 RepID=A0AAU9M372_9ASTR|nr:unnamed protein product [Lactuca virosa]